MGFVQVENRDRGGMVTPRLRATARHFYKNPTPKLKGLDQIRPRDLPCKKSDPESQKASK